MRQIRYKISITASFLLLVIFSLHAQTEGLEDLRYNNALYKEEKVATNKRASSSTADIIFLIDTLPLPFIDDFSRNRLKYYMALPSDPDIIQVEWEKFKVDGVPEDSIQLMYDTTWNYKYNPATQDFDSVPNNRFQVDFFKPSYPFSLDSTVFGYPPYSKKSVGANVEVTYYTPDAVYYNNLDTFLLKPDDGLSRWTGRSAFVNRSYAINPPTVGVATFDGVDSIGAPYNFANENGYGIADVLTSKPVDLIGLQASDNIYLSFFFQPQGRGNAPQEEDSLVLEFYAPVEKAWQRIWAKEGDTVQPFEEVFIAVDDPKYLKRGFRFRFKNYATLSGSLDHWNLDYVYLDKGRDPAVTTRKDLAYQEIGNSFINTYTSMPWRHYKESNTISNFPMQLKNYTSQTVNADNQYYVYDLSDSSLIFTSDNSFNNFPNLQSQTSEVFDHTFNNSSGNDFRFPADNEKTKSFRIEFVARPKSLNDIHQDNDSLIFHQHFKNYYAYDDGIPEKAYTLSGFGSKLAYKFTLEEQDTLKGLYYYFPMMFENITDRSVNLTVWSSLSPETILYQQNVFPVYETKFFGFHRYHMDSTLVLEPGTYYIGWEQMTSDKIYVGFDANIDNQDKIFYKTSLSDGQFYNTQFHGSLLIRPDFGYSGQITIKRKEIKEDDLEMRLFPNPVSDKLYFEFNKEGMNPIVRMFDITGRLVLEEQLFGVNYLDLSDIQDGIYMLRIELPGQKKTFNHKVIVTK